MGRGIEKTGSRTAAPMVVATAVAVLALLPYVLGAARLPLGPDASVYLWWFRRVDLLGLSAVSPRPGALVLAFSDGGALGLGAAASMIALEVITAVGVAVGITLLAARAGVSTTSGRIAAGIAAGVMALGLSAGWLSNATFAVCYLGAVVLLADDERSWLGPGVALGAAGICHPMFFALGASILLGVAGLELIRGPRDAGKRLAASVGLGTLLAAAGLMLASLGSTWMDTPTSAEGLFRAAGLEHLLAARYREGFWATWMQNGAWLALPIPLLLVGLGRGRGGRIVGVWVTVCLVAIPIFLVLGVAPATRLPRWALPLPILLALGWERVLSSGVPRAVRAALVASAMVAIAAVGVYSTRQLPDFSSAERGRIADEWASVAGDGTGGPIVRVVEHEPIQPAIHLAEAWNELRATLPPDRVQDVFVFYGDPARLSNGSPSTFHDPIDRSLSVFTLEQIRSHGGRPLLLQPDGPDTSPSTSWGDTLREATPGTSSLAVLISAIVWMCAGYPWARHSIQGRDAWMATFLLGPAVIVWSGLLVDRVGVSPSSAWFAILTLGGAVGLAYLVGRLDVRTADRSNERPASETTS